MTKKNCNDCKCNWSWMDKLIKDWINQFSTIPQFDVSIDKKGNYA